MVIDRQRVPGAAPVGRVFAALFVTLRPGGTGWSALITPLGFWAVYGPYLYISQRERIGSAVTQNSQAESFVRALTNASNPLLGVRQRWLAFNELDDAIVATQEERWSYQGAAPVLEVPWNGESGSLVSVVEKSRRFRRLVVLTFEDGSTVGLDLGRRNSMAMLDWVRNLQSASTPRQQRRPNADRH